MGHVRRSPPSSQSFDSEASLETNPWSLASEKRSAACPSRTGLVGGGREVESRCGQRGDPAGAPPAQAAPRERGVGLAFLGWGRRCAAILPLLLLLQDPKGECGRTQEGPPRGLGSLIFTLCRACACATRAGPWELGSAWGCRGSAPSVPTTPHVPLQKGEKETFIYPQTKRWQGGQQRWMTTALLETTTSRPGVLPV